MSNDNKTLADVQPGGRVRLGDQAERARFEAWALRECLTLHRYADGSGKYSYDRTDSAWKAWQYLSAQPSPGGQDALDCIGRIEEAIEFRVPHDIYAAVHGELAELKAALAARQPVSETVAYQQGFRDGQDRTCTVAASQPVGQGDSRSEKAETFLRQYLTYLRSSPRQGLRPRWCDVYEALEVAIEALAARQPVGEPAAWMTHHDEPMLFPTAAEASAYCEDDEQPVPLFRPPAQAVDLANVIDQIAQQWDGCNYDAVGETIDVGQAIRAAGKRLAMADSQAVGNG